MSASGSEVMATIVIADGASGVALSSLEGRPSPLSFTPCTWTMYSVPLVRPVISKVPPVLVTVPVTDVHSVYVPLAVAL